MRLAYSSEGADSAPLLVLSGGLGTTTAMWDAQIPSFAQRYRVLRIDHPGHGGSPIPETPVSVEGIGRAIVALLDRLGIGRASFCGVSLGGMVGQWLGANAPQRIEGLVLACTGAALGTPELYRERAELVRREGVEVVVDGARERWFTAPFRETPKAQRIIDELRTIPPEGYAACCEAVGDFDFRGELERIERPTLVLYGEHDSVTSPGTIDELATGIPHARKVCVAGAAHLANIEQPAAFAAAVLAHLKERVIA
jgi:3-oxoadipate enol-lactonase